MTFTLKKGKIVSDESERKKVIRKKLSQWTGTTIVMTENANGQTIIDTKTIDIKASDPDDYCGKLHDILQLPDEARGAEIYLDGKYVNHRVINCHIAQMGV